MNYVFDFVIENNSFLLKDTKYNNKLDSNLSFLPNGKKDIENFFIETKYSDSELVDEIKYDDFIDGFFPRINTHVFISHSHSDKNKAISLANFFYKKFGIRSFIDSEVWGYLDDALLELNKTYNPVDGKENTYCYEDCMKLSSNLNLILSSALTKMIDSSDCMIFINTDNSCKAANNSFSTKSPWIFTEILMSSLLKHKGHKDRPKKPMLEEASVHGMEKFESTTTNKGLVITYPLGMEHIVKVDDNILNNINKLNAKCHYLSDIYKRLGIPTFSNKEIFQNLDMIYDSIHFKP